MPETDRGRPSNPVRSATKAVEAPRVYEAPRVNVAFPFSAITVQEPSKDLVDLADVVDDLADLLVSVAPGSRADELKQRTSALTARLR